MLIIDVKGVTCILALVSLGSTGWQLAVCYGTSPVVAVTHIGTLIEVCCRLRCIISTNVRVIGASDANE